MKVNPRRLPFYVTLFLFALLFGFGAVRYTGFFSVQVFLNLLIDNAFLMVVAIGMTFVILSGGIDLSVGAVVALTTMISAALVEHHGWSIGVVVPLVLAIGALFGLMMGVLVQVFQIQPFIVTLGGMFLARGLCYLISIDSISITDPIYTALSQHKIFVGGGNYVSPSVVIALVVFAAAVWLAHFSRFGRTVYALGGNERSALLMGLPVARTRILVYVLSGLCSALGGVLVTFYMLSGYGLHAQGMELDAIAATVVGGTLLTGGVGLISGSVVGVLLLGVIQSLITFDGTLSSWWARIAIGVLLCLFCLMQRFLGRSQHGATVPPPGSHKRAPRPKAPAKEGAPSAVIVRSHAMPPFN